MPMLRYGKRGPNYWKYMIRQEQLRKLLAHTIEQDAKRVASGELKPSDFFAVTAHRMSKATIFRGKE